MNTKDTDTPQMSELIFPAASPLSSFSQRVGVTDVEIAYSRPGMKGRKVFGELVPYGRLWRTGADYATRLTFSTAVKLNGHDVAAGTYAVFSIPGVDEWTIILNTELKPQGTARYDQRLDVLRLQVRPTTLDHDVENLHIELDPRSEASASLDIFWERTKISIMLEVDFVEELSVQIATVMDSDREDKPYFRAALFYVDHDLDLTKAIGWIDKAIDRHPAAYSWSFCKARILAKMGDQEAALALAKQAYEEAKKADNPGFAALVLGFVAQNSPVH